MSQFYVALDDPIMRMMGGDLMSRSVGKIMDSDAPIQLGLISKQIETAQKRVEWANFDLRKNLVDYDDVMNKQREVFYNRRRKFLELADHALGSFPTEGIQIDENEKKEKQAAALEALRDRMRDVVLDELDFIVRSQFNSDKRFSEEALETLVEHVLDLAQDILLAKAFSVKLADLPSKLKDELRVLDQEAAYTFLEGGVKLALDDKLDEFGADFPVVSKVLMLESMDNQWVEHLETMTDIRSGIGLQGYAQRDPLVEYKNIAFRTFQDFILRIDSSVARRLLKVTKVQQVNLQQDQPQLVTNDSEISDISTGDREMMAGNTRLDELVAGAQQRTQSRTRQLQAASGKSTARKSAPEAGRNDPCPCGSGKKYKKCGMLNTSEHQQNMQKPKK